MALDLPRPTDEKTPPAFGSLDDFARWLDNMKRSAPPSVVPNSNDKESDDE